MGTASVLAVVASGCSGPAARVDAGDAGVDARADAAVTPTDAPTDASACPPAKPVPSTYFAVFRLDAASFLPEEYVLECCGGLGPGLIESEAEARVVAESASAVSPAASVLRASPGSMYVLHENGAEGARLAVVSSFYQRVELALDDGVAIAAGEWLDAAPLGSGCADSPPVQTFGFDATTGAELPAKTTTRVITAVWDTRFGLDAMTDTEAVVLQTDTAFFVVLSGILIEA